MEPSVHTLILLAVLVALFCLRRRRVPTAAEEEMMERWRKQRADQYQSNVAGGKS